MYGNKNINIVLYRSNAFLTNLLLNRSFSGVVQVLPHVPAVMWKGWFGALWDAELLQPQDPN